MNTLLRFALVLLLVAPAAYGQKTWDELEYPELNPIEMPDAERVELDNGLILYLVEDHELPLVNLSARIGTGSVYEPADKVGLAGVTAQVMRTGGTATRSGDDIDLALESIGASVEMNMIETSGTASMSVLKDDVDLGLDILADILMHPAFPEEKIDLAKTQERTGIARRNDNAQSVAFREFDKLIYGAESPYARHTEYATLDAITRDDLVDFHAAYFHPNNTMIGVWGDFDTDEMIAKIRDAFGDWDEAEGFQRPERPEVDYAYDTSVNLVDKEDVNQSVVLMGHIGGTRDNPDYFALQVMNTILGGGFSSRLFSRVRSDQGLAYAVFGSYGANYGHPGQFYAGVMTKSESTVEAARSVMQEIRNMREEPVTDEELALAKDSFFNSFVFNFDSRGEVINRLMTYEYYGYPDDFLQQTAEAIEDVTKEDVQRVARKYLQPDQMRLLVVGKADEFGTPLSELGPVNAIDIAIPEPGDDLPEATDASLEAGRALLDAAVEAAGGKAAFTSIRSIRSTGTITIPQLGGAPLDFTSTVVLPESMSMTIATPMGELTQNLSEDGATMQMGDQAMPEQPGMREQFLSGLWREPVYLFARADDVDVQDLGTETVGGADARMLRVDPPTGSPFTLYLDAESLAPVQLTAREDGAEITTRFTNVQVVDGRRVALDTSSEVGGQAGPSASVTEIVFNGD